VQGLAIAQNGKRARQSRPGPSPRDSRGDGRAFHALRSDRRPLHPVDERFAQIDERFDRVDERFAQIDLRFSHMDKRFTHMDKRFDRLERRFDDLHAVVSHTFALSTTTLAKSHELDLIRQFSGEQQRIKERVDGLEQRVAKVEKKLES
jgi:archaellum component FlaC